MWDIELKCIDTDNSVVVTGRREDRGVVRDKRDQICGEGRMIGLWVVVTQIMCHKNVQLKPI